MTREGVDSSRAGVINALAARVRVLEKSGRSECDLVALILAGARKAHDALDRAVGAHSHNLTVAARRAAKHGLIDMGVLGKVRRLATAANALRHVTAFSVEELVGALERLPHGAVVHGEGPADTDTDTDLDQRTRHALGLAEYAVRGLDILLTQSIQSEQLPKGAEVFDISDDLGAPQFLDVGSDVDSGERIGDADTLPGPVHAAPDLVGDAWGVDTYLHCTHMQMPSSAWSVIHQRFPERRHAAYPTVVRRAPMLKGEWDSCISLPAGTAVMIDLGFIRAVSGRVLRRGYGP